MSESSNKAPHSAARITSLLNRLVYLVAKHWLLLANAVKRLVQSPALAQKIRFAGLKTVRERYTHERLVDQTEEYLQMVLQSTRPTIAQ